jgi:hypothetical protein
MKSHRVGADRPGEAVNGTISDRVTQRAEGCEVCLLPTQAKRGAKKRFCSDRCRLLSWAVDTLAKALKEGKAEGLTEKIRALASPGRMIVKVVHTKDIQGGNHETDTEEAACRD